MVDSVSENQNPKTEKDKNQENDNNTVEEEDDDVIDDDIEEDEGEEDKLSKIGLLSSLDSGPLPGTANVTIEVEEKNIFSYFLGYLFSKPEGLLSSLDSGSGPLRSWAYRCDQASDISAGAYLLRFKGLSYPLTTRISLQSQDWLNISSYKERMLGLSVGLLSTRHHDLAYNLTWRNLTDPFQMSSRSVRKQLGHSLLSSLKYKFTVDRRDSPLRPTRGYAFVSSTQVGGLSPDSRSLRFLRQASLFLYVLAYFKAQLCSVILSSSVLL
ncbi:hypothetical protein IFM89_009012 [Coptis chinensis]|uniref:Bacterial surface antigen (D15) domain-containing protein n=1 Tax=Coptis chinensis TaxID=261450 RepID=A0A835I264_9MAGN|nr:hypothetical protein IFM89_009012 [Coptis chinensis]